MQQPQIPADIFTGGKGGTGRTLLSLVDSIYWLLAGKHVLIIDLNFHNVDLAGLLGRVADKRQELPLGAIGFSYSPIELYNDAGDIITSYLVYPKVGDFFGRIPLGIDGIYNKLNDILRIIQSPPAVFKPEIVIIDTGLHLSHMYPIGPNPPVGILAYPHISALKPTLWFCWTLASALRTGEIQAAGEGLQWLTQNGWLSLPENLIHVINPYVITESIRVARSDVVIMSMKKFLYRSHLTGPISYIDFRNSVKRAALQYPNGMDRKVFLNEIVFQLRFNMLDQEKGLLFSRQNFRGGFRPSNVLPIPYYRRRLTGYTDALQLASIDNVYLFQEELGNIYNAFAAFQKKR